jgi:hypothetical protein
MVSHCFRRPNIKKAKDASPDQWTGFLRPCRENIFITINQRPVLCLCIIPGLDRTVDKRECAYLTGDGARQHDAMLGLVCSEMKIAIVESLRTLFAS